VTVEDFGGLSQVVSEARNVIKQSLTKRSTLKRMGVRPVRGILFTGAPGTGKTLLARIIAQENSSEFIVISGPEILGQWIGQSEKELRRVFELAAAQESCIIFFDEIDSIAGHRHTDVHEASKRLVAQFLVQMDGFENEGNVVVIAATNRPEDIDKALRRPGRFDRTIHFPTPTRSDRIKILEASGRKCPTQEALPHEWVADRTEDWSAADLAAIWREAANLALDDEREVFMEEDYIGGYVRVASQRHHSGRHSWSVQ
jgi:transitional endoplasmic reticulum ATPase